MNGKKGATHVEMIVSMVIFITFVGVALFVMPLLEKEEIPKDGSLFYLNKNILSNISTEVEKYTIKIDRTEPLSVGPVLIEFQIDENKKESIFNVSGQKKESKYESSRIMISANEEDLFYLYVGEDFVGGNSFDNGPLSNMEIISSERIKFYSEKRFKNLMESYESDYEGLKERLKVPKSMDFDFFFVKDNGLEIGKKENPKGVSIYSSEERIKIINSSDEFEYVDVIIRTW